MTEPSGIRVTFFEQEGSNSQISPFFISIRTEFRTYQTLCCHVLGTKHSMYQLMDLGRFSQIQAKPEFGGRSTIIAAFARQHLELSSLPHCSRYLN